LAEGGARVRSADLAVQAVKQRLDPDDEGLLVSVAPLRDELARFRFRLPEDHIGVARDLLIGVRQSFRRHGLDLSIDPDPGMHWPHAIRGGVCLFGAGERPRSTEPSAIVNECIDRFHKLIHWVIRGANAAERDAEFGRELITYWQNQLEPDRRPLRLLRRPDTSVTLFALSAPHADGRVRAELLSPEKELLQTELGRAAQRREQVRAPIAGAFYARLRSQPSVQLPPAGEIFGWIEQFLSEDDAGALRRWSTTSAGLPLRWLLVELPNTSPAQVVAFAILRGDRRAGFQPRYGRRAHRGGWSAPAASCMGYLRLSHVDVLAEDVIFSRNSDESLPALRDAHVLMAGAGCLGSMVGRHLLRAGVGQLTIVDPQLFEAENLGRHDLGASDLNQFKAEALAARFQADSLSCIVRGVPQTLAQAMRDPALLKGVDLVVVTTADPASEMALWELKSAAGAPWAVVQGWAEPQGFVAHALVAPRGAFTAAPLFDDYRRFRHAFTSWPNEGIVTLPACGTGFIPAGPLAIGAAASLVANAVVQALAEPADQPKWHYVVNDPDRVAAKGGTYIGPQQPPGCRQWTNAVPWPAL